jgi:hypothetical protein
MRHVEWVGLTDAQRGQLVGIWLLAADHNGVIPASPQIIKKLCHMDTEPDLKLFIDQGFIDAPQDGVKVASNGSQSDSPEKSREETEKKRVDAEKIAAAFSLPDWIDKKTWDLWLKTRKGKKMIPEQMQAQVDKLEKWKNAGLDYAGALSASAEAGWQGLFEPKNGSAGKNFQTPEERRMASTDKAIAEWLGEGDTIEGECRDRS